MALPAVTDRAAPPTTENDPLVSALEPLLERFSASRERRESLFMFRCLRLAPDLETFEALLRGERVARTRLDPLYVKAYRR